MTTPDPELMTALIERLTVYRDTLIAKADLPLDVTRAANDVLSAGHAFQEDLGDTTGWYIGLFRQTDDEEEDEDHEPEPLSAGQRVSVVVREDFVIVDEDTLVRAGRSAYKRSWPDASEESASQQVGSALDALTELLHADGLDDVARNATEAGLENAGGETSIEPVEQALQDDPGW